VDSHRQWCTFICLSITAKCNMELPSWSLELRNNSSPLADSTNNLRASKWLYRRHKCNTLSRMRFTRMDSCRAITNSFMISMRPLIVAKWGGILSYWSTAEQIFLFACNNAFIISVWPSAEARWRGVHPNESTSFTSVGFLLIRTLLNSKWPCKADKCKESH
jgi:hypothetical protein